VVAIGDVDDPAASVIDADGRVVAPGSSTCTPLRRSGILGSHAQSVSAPRVTTVMGGTAVSALHR